MQELQMQKKIYRYGSWHTSLEAVTAAFLQHEA